MTSLAFSPDCRYVAEWGNSVSGGGASFTFDEYKVRVFDTTNGICVFTRSRREQQGWCSPYRRSGATLESVKWHHPHTLEIKWSDGQVDEEALPFPKGYVSSFHF